jgi:hypothetical protein
MSLLRYVAVLILAVWVGGLAVLGGVAAPAIFSVLEAHDPATGRELGGVLFGDIFGRFQYLAWGLGAVLLLSLGLRAALGPRPRRLALRVWIAAAMLAVSVVTVVAIAPRIDAIQASVTGTIAALPDTDARKVAFGRLHGLANALMLVTLAAGVGLLWAEMRDQA